MDIRFLHILLTLLLITEAKTARHSVNPVILSGKIFMVPVQVVGKDHVQKRIGHVHFHRKYRGSHNFRHIGEHSHHHHHHSLIRPFWYISPFTKGSYDISHNFSFSSLSNVVASLFSVVFVTILSVVFVLLVDEYDLPGHIHEAYYDYYKRS